MLGVGPDSECVWFGETNPALPGVTAVAWVPGKENEFVAAYGDGCLRIFNRDLNEFRPLEPKVGFSRVVCSRIEGRVANADCAPFSFPYRNPALE